MSHTPGPWQQNGSHIYGPDANNANHHWPVCQMWYHGKPSDDANARLIAAAPDLLEALRDVLKHGGESADEWIDVRYYRKAQLAIAKAEGRS